MQSQQATVRPIPLSTWLLPGSVRSCLVEPDQIRLVTRTGEVELPLATLQIHESRAWWFLRRVRVSSPEGDYTINGLSPGSARRISEGAAEARRRANVRGAVEAQWSRLEQIHQGWTELVSTDRYVCHSDLAAWRAALPQLDLPTERDLGLFMHWPAAQQKQLGTLCHLLANLEHAVNGRNEAFVRRELERFRTFFDRAERYPLTPEQRKAVVYDEDHALVIAGAGTGKTATVLAKVGYLLHKKLAQPHEILLLAFTQLAASELRERIETKFGIALEVRTFHALGLEILARSLERKPSLCPEAEDRSRKEATFRELLEGLLQEPQLLQVYLEFQAQLRAPYRSAWDFRTEAEYRDHLLQHEPRTLEGRLVRSYEECEIANWLTLHGIRYEYERPYPVDLANREHRQYRPDFYLPDYDLYLEHWALDRSGNTPPFIARSPYLEKLEWARRVHREQGTGLVETFSWERREGVLLGNLEAHLRGHGVRIGFRSWEEALQKLREIGVIDPFVKLATNFHTLYKSGSFTPERLAPRRAASRDPKRSSLFLAVYGRLHQAYEGRLHSQGEIDFEDMISQATQQVRSGTYPSPFRYVLVDEFQDISQGRADLIRALLAQVAGAKLFCVGDDWQSIYRFTGSDLALMTGFGEHFGFTRTTALGHTFRFTDRLEAFSSRFVQRNGAQLCKSLTAHSRATEPAVVICWREGKQDLVGEVLAELAALGKASVLLLNRYRFQFAAGYVRSLERRFPELALRCLTAHGAKGLEADYVIVDNLQGGRYGFPSEVEDDPLLELVLAEQEAYPHAEERRLFYVALTRARKRVYLIADPDVESTFIRELLSDPGYEKVVRGESSGQSDICPDCGRGRIRRRDSQHGVFYGCSKYPLCEYKEDPCASCRKGRLIRLDRTTSCCDTCHWSGKSCPRCREGVLLLKRRRKDGRPFYGCSGYRSLGDRCSYTEDAVKSH